MKRDSFLQLPVIGIIRGVSAETLLGTLEAAEHGGLSCLEITLNTANAYDLIAQASQLAKSKSEISTLTIGAGTVCTLEEAKQAVVAGATFIVSPISDTELISWCQQQQIPIFAGAATPTEVYRAWAAGATMVKVFPADSLGGPAYIKQLKGPFADIKLLACSGVRPDNLKDYFLAGVSAVAIGNSIFNQEWMLRGEYEKIAQAAKLYVQSYNATLI